ncbi:DnaJ domain-containing protein [Sphingomonas yantingensis]|nr:DnaJ domain-containing protein [Sphingomonas yantingensis]
MNSTVDTLVCSKPPLRPQLRGWGVSNYCSPSYYDVLMVPQAADAATVRAAFRALIRTWHPDCGEQGGSQDRAARIIEAYRTLSHPERRRQYDRRRQQVPIPPEADRRKGERRRPAARTGSPARVTDRRRTMLWGASTGGAALVAIATFLPSMLVSTDLSRDVLRALIQSKNEKARPVDDGAGLQVTDGSGLARPNQITLRRRTD